MIWRHRFPHPPVVAEHHPYAPVPAEELAIWQQPRTSVDGSRLSRFLPRFLPRMPYGRDSLPVDSLPVEKIAFPEHNDEYLWGNASVLGALGWAQSRTAAATVSRRVPQAFIPSAGGSMFARFGPPPEQPELRCDFVDYLLAGPNMGVIWGG